MKLVLLEAVPSISEDIFKKWNKGSTQTRRNITEQIIKAYPNKGLKNIKDAIFENFDFYGIDESKNPYMKFLDELEFEPKKGYEDNFKLLNDYIQSGKVDLSHDYLRFESLYNRPKTEFDYTLNAFEIVMDKKELSKYFTDTTHISEDQFIDPTSGDILPAGKPGDEGIDTIYGVIEQWSTDDTGHSNKVSSTNYEYTLNDAIKRFKIPYTQQANVVKKWILEYFNKASKIEYPIENKSYYVNTAYNYLTTDKLRLTKAMQDKILKQKSYSTLKDIPRSEKVEGNIIFVREKEHLDRPLESNLINTYLVFHDGNWITYDEYSTAVKQDKRSTLLNMKVISNISDKVEITAGVIRALDKMSDDDDKANDINNYL